ncbi:EpsG family protein [Leuconostoc citreum]|uniref:EpsG family protein n=1 Tax=Leuconostoc citreum TaxID=33964 RepID=UPI000EEBA676|nr:EpsG family protein [Leuconostoc citreum]MCJ2166619.1 EpsG family protein [Leuconostoc citreum]MCT3071891.1 EpsG family protein [Leuconostoc citreum]MDY5161983.1 EpsG family protein [Leuconostoc citreum]MDY5165539.1 EpsG family protein [Leuconostoc citreum]HCN55706.1 hypothetical protein [Leuconostoc citreum]
MIYLYVFILSLLSCSIFFITKPFSIKIGYQIITIEHIVYWISIIWLAWIIGNRGLAGTDTFTYKVAFTNPAGFQYFEPGYKFVSSLVADLGLDFTYLQLVMSFGTMIVFGIAYSLANSKTTLSLFYFIATGVFYTLFNTMRQGMAEALFLLAVVLFFKLNGKKKYITSGLILYAAYLFHASVIVVVLIVLVGIVVWKLLNSWFYFLIIIISFLGLLGIRVPITQFSSIFSKLGLSYISSYSDYLGEFSYGVEGYITLILFLLIVILTCGSNQLFQNDIYRLSYMLFLLYLVISSVFGYGGLMNRFLNYFVPFFPILFVYLPKMADSSIKKLSIQIIIFMYILEFIIYTFLSNYQLILPYRP